MTKTVTVSVHCDYFYFGESGYFVEPPDCSNEFNVDVSLESWEAGDVEIKCNRCGSVFEVEDFERGAAWVDKKENADFETQPLFDGVALDGHYGGWE